MNVFDMELQTESSFYIASAIFFLLAVITATGKLDTLFCKKYSPALKNGKFAWKQITYNPKRMRPLLVAMLVIISLLLLAVPLFGLSETAVAVAVLLVAVAVLLVTLLFSVVAMMWAVEKE